MQSIHLETIAERPLIRLMPCAIHQVLVSRELGGAAEIALLLAAQLQRTLGEVQNVWLPGRGRAWEHAQSMGLRVRSYDRDSACQRSMIQAAWGNTRFAFQLRHEKVNCVHIHDPFTYAALRHGIRWANAPVVVHVQLEYSIEDLRWAFRAPPDAIVTCADFLRKKVRDALPGSGDYANRVFTVRNSVDTNRFWPGDRNQAKWQMGIGSSQPMVLMLANLASHKGQATAIRAVAELKRTGLEVQCWLAGVDRSTERLHERWLRSLCHELDVQEQVKFLGFRSDTAELLQAADLLLLPSTHEGLPLTILEAQATGIPVLAAPTAGVPEAICNGESGFLIDAQDYKAYAARIRKLIDNPRTYQRIATTARDHCLANHSWSRFWDQMQRVYESVGMKF
jgi:glycosyltransferase involved in cell wall biosynthesis